MLCSDLPASQTGYCPCNPTTNPVMSQHICTRCIEHPCRTFHAEQHDAFSHSLHENAAARVRPCHAAILTPRQPSIYCREAQNRLQIKVQQCASHAHLAPPCIPCGPNTCSDCMVVMHCMCPARLGVLKQGHNQANLVVNQDVLPGGQAGKYCHHPPSGLGRQGSESHNAHTKSLQPPAVLRTHPQEITISARRADVISCRHSPHSDTYGSGV
jgi:hypothetical protein